MSYIVQDATFYNPTHDGIQRNMGSDSLGKDDFLKLLVTQLQFQDPMEPMQDQEFVAQLAQFSQLEALENMSNTLDTNSEVDYIMSQTIANTMATTLIGKQVIAEGSDFVLKDDSEAELSFDLGGDAANVVVNIYDEDGDLIRTIELENLSEGMNTVTWDGKNGSGTRVSAGTYSYKVHATTSSDEELQIEARTIGEVESVKYIDGIAYLVVNGHNVELGSILEIVDENTQVNNNDTEEN